MNKHIIINIEGSDASGKETQANLLKDHLGYEMLSFPVYKEGDLLTRHLMKGVNLDPKKAAFYFAMNRFENKDNIENKNIVLDRYVYSNIMYQSARMKLEGESDIQIQHFIDYQLFLEFKTFALPEPDVVMFLDVPFEISQKLNKKRGSEDAYEKDLELRKISYEFGKTMMKEKGFGSNNTKHWITIDCTEDGKLLPKEVVFSKILSELDRLKIGL